MNWKVNVRLFMSLNCWAKLINNKSILNVFIKGVWPVLILRTPNNFVYSFFTNDVRTNGNVFYIFFFLVFCFILFIYSFHLFFSFILFLIFYLNIINSCYHSFKLMIISILKRIYLFYWIERLNERISIENVLLMIYFI